MKKARVSKKQNQSLNKQFMISAAKVIAQKIVDKKASNNGRAPWGYSSNLLKQGKEIYPNMSMRTINNYIKRIEKGEEYGRVISLDGASSNQLSSLTSPSKNGSDASNQKGISDTTSDNASTSSDESSDESTESEQNTTSNDDSKMCLGGRPKGSTVAASLSDRKRYEDAMIDAVEAYKKVKAKVKRQNKRMKKGELSLIILDIMEKHDLRSTTYSINEKAIRQRFRQNTKSAKHGLKSPLLEIEPYVVTLILQLADMRVPLTTSQGLQLCNSIIKGTKYEKYVSDFKESKL
jgi:hypothetical protein